MPPPALLPSGGIEFEVESIIGHQVDNVVRQFLVQWKGDPIPGYLEESELTKCKPIVVEYCLKTI